MLLLLTVAAALADDPAPGTTTQIAVDPTGLAYIEEIAGIPCWVTQDDVKAALGEPDFDHLDVLLYAAADDGKLWGRAAHVMGTYPTWTFSALAAGADGLAWLAAQDRRGGALAPTDHDAVVAALGAPDTVEQQKRKRSVLTYEGPGWSEVRYHLDKAGQVVGIRAKCGHTPEE